MTSRTSVPGPTLIGSWQQAEANAVQWMRAWGISDAALTGAGSDAGIDITSRTALAQVKREATPTGRPALQQLVGARGHDQHKRLLFFSATGFTTPALAYAEQMTIALFQYDLDGTMRPLTPAARSVVEAARAAQRAAEKARVEQYRSTVHHYGPSTRARHQRWSVRWPLPVAAFFAFAVLSQIMSLMGDAPPERLDWWGPISYSGIVVFLIFLWRRLRARALAKSSA